MATYNSDGSLSDVNAKIGLCNPGDTVTVPSGSFTWGTSGTHVDVNKAINLVGAGTGSTTITMAASGPSGSNGVIRISAAATVQSFATVPASNVAVFALSGNGFRITDITHNLAFSSATGYFAFVNNVYGLIDGNNITGASGTNELIYVKGPSDAWQNVPGFGDANAVYIERNIFNGPGYVCDINSNGKGVVRFNKITGGMKIDGHGLGSNGAPPTFRGVRRLEAYGNLFTYTTVSTWTAIEARGGAGLYFDNISKATGANASTIMLRDYGYSGQFGGFQFIFQTPYNYPILDQIGAGTDETVAVTAIGAGDYVGIASPGNTNFTLIGAANSNAGTWFFATGAGTGTGTVTRNGATEPNYLWGNYKNNTAWARTYTTQTQGGTYTTNNAGYSIGATSITLGAINTALNAGNSIAFAGDTNRYLLTNTVTTNPPKTITIASPGLQVAIPGGSTVSATVKPDTLWQYQQGNSSATFGEADIIQPNRDFYSSSGFDYLTGVTVGLASDMSGATPTLHYGYAATDDGTWNQSFTGTVAATAIEEWDWCEIVTVGTTDFTAIGARANTVGVRFLATGAGTGNGTVKPAQTLLYTGNGSNWVLTYTPYSYPYTSDAPPVAPNLVSATVNSAGSTLTLVWSASCTNGVNGGNGMALTASGGAVTATYSTGSGSTTYVYTLNRTIQSGESMTVSYVQPGNGIESTAAQIDVESFTNQAVTNNSNISGTQSTSFRPLAAISGGF